MKVKLSGKIFFKIEYENNAHYLVALKSNVILWMAGSKKLKLNCCDEFKIDSTVFEVIKIRKEKFKLKYEGKKSWIEMNICAITKKDNKFSFVDKKNVDDAIGFINIKSEESLELEIRNKTKS